MERISYNQKKRETKIKENKKRIKTQRKFDFFN